MGLTEKEAREKYGAEALKIYTSDFINLYYGSFYEGGPGDKPVTKYKLICEGPQERVVGLHMIGEKGSSLLLSSFPWLRILLVSSEGMGSDEVLQGFGVALKMGATKADLDNCVAIHPTAAEEMVTLAPWGLPGTK